jgi:hypothetical protein
MKDLAAGVYGRLAQMAKKARRVIGGFLTYPNFCKLQFNMQLKP